MFHVVLREFTRCSWIPGCRELIQERGNIRGEFTHRGNGGIGRRKPRPCKRLKGEILPGSLLPGLVGPHWRGGTGTGNGGDQAVEESIWNPKL